MPYEPHLLAADRNLLFGILALQMNFVTRDALVGAMHAWVLEKSKSVGQLLFERRSLTAEQLQALDVLIVEHLKVHGNDPERSVRALPGAATVQSLLLSVSDQDVQSTLARFGSGTEVDATHSYASPPSEGARYQKRRRHAQGGLGEVFVAEDAELHREVALKEIKGQYAHDLPSRQRFIVEAEITGGLEHPGIVPVYGLGTYSDGRPFYAMRFIRGETLREAIEHFHAAEKPGRDARERSLALRQLLRRFIDVCNAIAYAHARGVLHRDLKPANIMLGKFGETLVVDWGLAKFGLATPGTPLALNDAGPPSLPEAPLRPASGPSVAATQMGLAPGTAPFMSPEQAAGRVDELGPASDIYSLGSTLYVLLTGKRPYEGQELEAILKQVQRGQFAPPRQIKPETSAALDAICRKAMAFQPSERYASALDLAADVEHWLADEPATAYPEPWTIRAGRWGRRHRTALVGAAVFLFCTVAALSVSTALVWAEQRQTERQRNAAQRNFQLAREQSFHIIDLIESSEAEIASVPSLHKTRQDILVLASTAYARYLEEDPDDTELRRRAAQVYRYTANVHRLVNERDPAEPLYQASTRLYADLAKANPDEAEYRQRWSETLRDHAKLKSNYGKLKEAAEMLQTAVAVADELHQADPKRANYRRALAAALLSLAGLDFTRGRLTEANANAVRAEELFRELAAQADGFGPYDTLLRAAALNITAVVERKSGRLDGAYEAHKEPIKLVTELRDKPRPGLSPVDVRHFLAAFQLEQCRTWALYPQPKRRANAETNLNATIVQWEALAKAFPRVPMYREWLAEALQERGKLRASDHSRREEAGIDLRRSQKLLEERVNETPGMPGPAGDLGRTYLELARLARVGGDAGGAEAWLEKAHRALSESVRQSPEHAKNKTSLAQVQAER